MKIIVIGGKGTASNIAYQINDARNNYNSKDELLGISIDDETLGSEINGIPILCKTNEISEKYNKFKDVKYIFALYKSTCMKERVALLNSYKIDINKFCNFIHPSAVYLGNEDYIGLGNVIFSQCTIHQNVKMGNFNIINSNVVIEHDTIISDCNFVAASCCLGSNIKMGTGNFIGLNSTIRENVVLNDYSFVGMGSNVLDDIELESVYYGNPAKKRIIF